MANEKTLIGQPDEGARKLEAQLSASVPPSAEAPGTSADDRARAAEVVIWSGEWDAYWGPDGGGYHSNPDFAGIYSREDAVRRTRHCGPEKRIEIRPVPQTPFRQAQAEIARLTRERDEAREDRERLDWLQEQIVDTIYLDDGRIIDVAGDSVRVAIDGSIAARSIAMKMKRLHDAARKERG